MEEKQKFKFSAEEIKKINVLLPKGYKFVTEDELNKKSVQKRGPKKRTNLSQVLSGGISESVTPPLPKSKGQREDQYQPDFKVPVPPPPVVIPVQEFPAGTKEILLQRIKKHPAYSHLLSVNPANSSDISLRDIEDKVKKEGDLYTINDLESDFRHFFHTVYKESVKTSNDYRQAGELDNHILNLLKVEKGGDLKKADNRGNQGGRKRAPQVKIYQPLASYKVATTIEKRQLGMMIRKLASENLQQVINIMCESTEVKECIFDLDNIHIKKFRELEEYVKKCMQKNQDWDPRTMEDQSFSNESEFVIENDDS